MDIDELVLNLIMDYPRITSNWIARALDVSVSTANRHLKRLRESGHIVAYMTGAYTNYEYLYWLDGAMPEFFNKPEASGDLEPSS